MFSHTNWGPTGRILVAAAAWLLAHSVPRVFMIFENVWMSKDVMDFFSSAADVSIHSLFFSLSAHCWDPDALLNNLNQHRKLVDPNKERVLLAFKTLAGPPVCRSTPSSVWWVVCASWSWTGRLIHPDPQPSGLCVRCLPSWPLPVRGEKIRGGKMVNSLPGNWFYLIFKELTLACFSPL